MSATDSSDGMDEIVQEFLVESHENLDQLDRDFVELERAPESRELLASVFRTIHTIKGTSGFLGYGNLEKVTHVGENLLARLRDGDRVLDAATTDVLLLMVDAVRAVLAAIEETGVDAGCDVSGAVEAVRRVLDTPQGVLAPVDAEPEVEPEVASRRSPSPRSSSPSRAPWPWSSSRSPWSSSPSSSRPSRPRSRRSSTTAGTPSTRSSSTPAR